MYSYCYVYVFFLLCMYCSVYSVTFYLAYCLQLTNISNHIISYIIPYYITYIISYISITTFILITHGLKPNEWIQPIAITFQKVWLSKSDNGDWPCPLNISLTFQYTWWRKSTKLTTSDVIYHHHNTTELGQIQGAMTRQWLEGKKWRN